MTHAAEEIATAVLISLVGGIFVTIALAGGTERALIVWLLTVICAGLVVGRLDHLAFGIVLKRAVWPALVLAVTPVSVFYVFSILAFIKDPKSFQVPWQDFAVSPLDPFVVIGVLLLLLACFAASILFVGGSAMASRLLLIGARRLYGFGPEAIDRIKLIVIALAGVLAAVFALIPMLKG